MSDFLFQYGLFAAQTATLVVALLVVLGFVIGALRHSRGRHDDGHLEVTDLNHRFREMAHAVEDALLDERERKARDKRERRRSRQRQNKARERVFVLDFQGDLHASGVEALREEITAILQVARNDDELVLRLESEGGVVHGYGLAASQLARLREAGLRLTVAIDKVAASGGYLMACVAHRIIAAPFAIVGSIGVVGQLPNFHRWLQRHEIDYELHTAGEYKRTLTLFGENTEAARQKFREELEETHALFKRYVSEYRPIVPLARVATGETWFGRRALELKLVDEIKTSDDYLLARSREADVIAVRWQVHRSLPRRLLDEWTLQRARRRRDLSASALRI